MAYAIRQNPGLLLKVSASSMNLKTALANLIAHHKSVQEEKEKDRGYYEMLASAYSDSEDDMAFAELFSGVSSEVDDILREMRNPNE